MGWLTKDKEKSAYGGDVNGLGCDEVGECPKVEWER